MRITLMHNPNAGDAEYGGKELMAALAKAGHEVSYQSTEKSGYENGLKKPTDLVLAAGGDGTVVKVACQLIDTGIPLSVLPLGTANNLARSLGFIDSPEEIIARLQGGKKRTFDIGVTRGPGARGIFLKQWAAVCLQITFGPRTARLRKTKEVSKKREMDRHVSLLRRMLHDYPAQQWKIDIDGEDIRGRYILWEAMNIRSVRPVLYLASQAATRDGQLDFVCAREADRSLLIDHLGVRLAKKSINSRCPFGDSADYGSSGEERRFASMTNPGRNGKNRKVRAESKLQ